MRELFMDETVPPDHDSARKHARSALLLPHDNAERNLAVCYLALCEKQRYYTAPVEVQIRNEFQEWYAEYPRKKDPGLALKAYRKARQAGATAAQLLGAVRNYRWNPDPHYIKYPASWLNAEAWRENPADEPVKASQVNIWAQAARSALGQQTDFLGTTIDGEVVHG